MAKFCPRFCPRFLFCPQKSWTKLKNILNRLVKNLQKIENRGQNHLFSKNVDKNVDSENVDLTRFLRGQNPFVHVF